LSKASRAAATAASMSAFEAAGTLPIRSSERGEITSNDSSDPALRQSPPMKNAS